MIVIPAAHSHAQSLAFSLRKADLRELQATTSEAPIVALDRLLHLSDPCLTVMSDEDEVLGMFGAIPSLSRSGEVWLLGSDGLTSNPRSLLRLTIEWIARLHHQYNCLWCNVDSRNVMHLRWLCWAGFSQTAIYEFHGREQRRFEGFSRFAHMPVGRR